MTAHRKTRLITSTSLGLALALMAPQLAAAQNRLPQGASIVSGEATIAAPDGLSQNIYQTSQRAIIDWASFNVGYDNALNFHYNNTESATLNRVTGDTATTIAGRVTGNGSIYLVNPNGIQITETGNVIVQKGFVASTLDISNTDFMNGTGQFSGTGGTIELRGIIIAGDGNVGLLGGNVYVTGTILAQSGNIVIGATTQATLDINGGGFLQVAMPASAALSQNGNQAFLTPQGQYDAVRNVVNLEGLGATNISGTHGNIVLRGMLDNNALSGDAGSITVTGNHVTVGGSINSQGYGFESLGGIVTVSGNVVNIPGVSIDTSSLGSITGSFVVNTRDVTINDAYASQIHYLLEKNNVTLNALSGGQNETSIGKGDININADIGWTENRLSLNAANDININKVMTASSTAGLTLNYGNSANTLSAPTAGSNLNFARNQDNFVGRIDLVDYGNTLKVNNDAYTIIHALGVQGSTTQSDLQGINGNLTGKYALGANIDASATAGWNNGSGFNPIGSGSQNGFEGTLLGLGHTVSDLKITRNQDRNAGLFNTLAATATVSALGLRNVDVSADGNHASGLDGGMAGALAAMSLGTITNSFATGNVSANGSLGKVLSYFGSSEEAKGGDAGVAGGLVGHSNGSIHDSYAFVTTSADGGNGNPTNNFSNSGGGAGGSAGGLVGISFGQIKNSNALGKVTANGADAANTSEGDFYAGNGGIAGGLVAISQGTVINSYAKGDVEANSGAQNSYTSGGNGGHGGIAGGLIAISHATVTSSHATGNVTANGGHAKASSTKGGNGGFAGGLIAKSEAEILTSYATGNVTANGGNGKSDRFIGTGGIAGGLVAQSTAAIRNSYAMGAVSANGANIGDYAGYGGIGGTAGGLVGLNNNLIEYSFAAGAVHANGGTSGSAGLDAQGGGNGGVAGGLAGQTTGDIRSSYATGSASATGGNPSAATSMTGTVGASGGIAGGLAGIASGNISKSYATGTVNTNSGVGSSYDFLRGLRTYSHNGAGGTAGGLIGQSDANISFSYATGEVHNNGRNPVAGGFIGAINGGTVENAFWDSYSSKRANAYGRIDPSIVDVISTPTALTSDATKASDANYIYKASAWSALSAQGQDLDLVGGQLVSWRMYEGYTLPMLKALLQPGTVNLTVGNVNLTYNGQMQQASGVLSDTRANIIAIQTNALNAGDYVLSAYSNQQGYDLIVTNGVLNVARKALTITGNTASVTYNGANQTHTYQTQGLVASDTVTGVSGLVSAISVGSYADNLSGATGTGLSNYDISYVNGTLTINPKALTITGNTGSAAYNGQAQTNGFTSNGLIQGDSITSVQGLAQLTNVGTVADNLSNATGSGLENYLITYENGALAITPLDLTVTYIADTATMIYGAAENFTGRVEVEGLIGSDTLLGELQWTSASGPMVNIGQYGLIGSGLSASANYTLTSKQSVSNQNAITIIPRTITVTANDQYLVYGQALSPLTWTVGGMGLANGDTLSGQLQTRANGQSPAGIYSITQGTLAATSNYDLVYVGGAVTISQPATTDAPSQQMPSYESWKASLRSKLDDNKAILTIDFNTDTVEGGRRANQSDCGSNELGARCIG